jgi:nucleoside-diphosphate-sugar epimerase
MNTKIHTVLGASGAVGSAIISTLQQRGISSIRSVNRNSKTPNTDSRQADLSDIGEAQLAIAGSDYVYLCIGLPYLTKIWEVEWEKIMHNVITACATNQAKLIFLDNIYMYGAPLPTPFDENTPQQPTSNKGKARKRTADMMLKAMDEGIIKGVIGRSADFYGAGAVNSPFYISFLERMLKGKAPQFLTSPEIEHTYANVRDNGRALVELARCEDCYGQVWHLPVGPPITPNEMLALFNKKLGANYKINVVPTIARKLLSLFISPLKEVSEMLYQFENPYLMSFDKFSKQFPDFEITTYQTGIDEMIASFKNKAYEN